MYQTDEQRHQADMRRLMILQTRVLIATLGILTPNTPKNAEVKSMFESWIDELNMIDSPASK